MNDITLSKFNGNEDNYKLMYKWCNEDYIYEWFEQRKLSYKEIVDKYSNKLNGNQKLYIINYENKKIGYFQVYQYNEKNDYLKEYHNIYEYDLFIGEKEYLNKGIGSLVVQKINDMLFYKYNADCIILRPCTRNIRAIKCYEKNGFYKIYDYNDKDTIGNKETYTFLINKKIKYLILDFGMVLGYPITNWFITPKFMELIDINKIGEENINKAIDNNKILLNKKIKTLDEEYEIFLEFYKNILLECKCNIELAKIIANNRVYNDTYKLFDYIKEDLKRLAKKYQLILLSDNWPDSIYFLKKNEIYDLFKKVYISSDYGELKIDGKFFDYPINEFNIKENEALFIDDNEDILDVAVKKKLKVKQMDRNYKINNSKYEIIHDLKIML